MYVEKSPEERTYYTATWAGRLAPDETIASVDEWRVVGDGTLELGVDAPYQPQQNGPLVTVWCWGGTDGSSYVVECYVTTSSGQKLRGFFVVQVRAA